MIPNSKLHRRLLKIDATALLPNVSSRPNVSWAGNQEHPQIHLPLFLYAFLEIISWAGNHEIMKHAFANSIFSLIHIASHAQLCSMLWLHELFLCYM